MKREESEIPQKLRDRLRTFNPTDIIILWVLIWSCAVFLASIVPSLLCQYGVPLPLANHIAMVSLISITLIIIVGRFYNMQVKSFLEILSVLITAGALLINAKGLFIQNDTLENNLRQSQLSTRPLLSINLTTRIGKWNNADFFGGVYIIQNSASFPAIDMQVSPAIYYDMGQADNFEGWYAGNYGAYPDIHFIAARSASDPIISMPSVKPNVNFASIAVLVTYSGFESKRKYWQLVRKTYRLHWQDGELKDYFLVEDTQRSDSNSSETAPALEPPDFKSFNLKPIDPVTS